MQSTNIFCENNLIYVVKKKNMETEYCMCKEIEEEVTY
jgi:hypothetical protein